ncbi:hydroxymethylglutaryl-CoA synthase [Myxococcota bacterium]
MKVMKPNQAVGIVGYGAYIPRFRLPAIEVSRVWGAGCSLVPVREKSVPGLDEDVITMGIEAARNALLRAAIDAAQLGAVWVGSESHPYAVKPSSTVVAAAIGAGPHLLAADWQFACKAGTEALQGAAGLIGSGAVEYALAIGMDAAQSRPGDALEYTAGAGGAAFILGAAEQSLAIWEASLSFVSDTPDFWRREHRRYPEHAGRFTGEPSYFRHVVTAASELMQGLGTQPSDYRHVVFHQPNPKFPSKAAKMLGFRPEQLVVGQLVNDIGNTYAGAALLGLTAVLDEAQPGDRLLLVSYGSGAGSDAVSLRVNRCADHLSQGVPLTKHYVSRRTQIDYAKYARQRNKLATN